MKCKISLDNAPVVDGEYVVFGDEKCIRVPHYTSPDRLLYALSGILAKYPPETPGVRVVLGKAYVVGPHKRPLDNPPSPSPGKADFSYDPDDQQRVQLGLPEKTLEEKAWEIELRESRRRIEEEKQSMRENADQIKLEHDHAKTSNEEQTLEEQFRVVQLEWICLEIREAKQDLLEKVLVNQFKLRCAGSREEKLAPQEEAGKLEIEWNRVDSRENEEELRGIQARE